MHVITIDANIGAGKTTVLNWLNQNYNIPIDLEPIELWEPHLKELYKNKSNVFPFQVRVWLDRCFPKENNSILFMERSPYFQEDVFLNIAIQEQTMTEEEIDILQKLYNKINWKPSLYVYLKSDPFQCSKRINKRGRDSEGNIPHSYLEKLHELHEKCYQKALHEGVPTLQIDVESKTPEMISNEIISFMNCHMSNYNLPWLHI